MEKRKKRKISIMKLLFFGSFLLLFFKKEKKENGFSLKDLEHNFIDFAHEEEKEITKLIHHKEDIVEYIEDSESIFRDYFIPHRGNNHHPKILRKKQLLLIVVLALLLKVSLVSYLFFIYPNNAKMAEDMQAGVFNLLNEARVEQGLNPLVLNQALLDSATDRVDDMIANNYFAHLSLDGRMPWDFVSKRDYPYLYIGENLGMNFSSSASVHKALMNSPSHKKNILNKKYTDIGLVVKSAVINGRETNILVEIFGSEKKVELIPNPAISMVMTDSIESISEPEELKVLAKKIDVSNSKVEIQEKIKPEKIVKEVIKNEPKLGIPISKESIDSLKKKIELATIAKGEKEISSTSILMLGDGAKSFIKKKPASLDLETTLNKKIEFVTSVNSDDKYSMAIRISDYFNILLLGVLVLMTSALLINVFVKIRIQHKPALIQTFLLLILLFGIYSTKLHFLEKIPDLITIF